MILYQYISNQYPVSFFSLEGQKDHNKVLRKVSEDEEFLDLFCFIIGKRLIVIDDIEFKGENKMKSEFPFIPY
jgi:hypothetical protein